MLRVIATLLGCLILAVAVAFLIYYVIYTVVINHRISKGITDGKRLTDFSKIAMLVIIAVLAYMYWSQSKFYNSAYAHTRNNFVSVDVSDPDKPQLMSQTNSDIDDISYVTVYSDEENPGYDKNVYAEGDFMYTVFTRAGAVDDFHPDFLCFVEYMGDADESVAFYEMAGFESPEDDGRGWRGGSGGFTFPDEVLYMGNLDEDCTFVVNLCTLDEEEKAAYDAAFEQAMADDKGEFPEWSDFADEASEVRITL